MSTTWVTRLADHDDAEAIRTIYNHFVESSTATFDLRGRSLQEQQAWLSERSGAHAVIVIEDMTRGEIAGFASLSPWRDRPGYRTSVEDSVYVHPDHHQRGIGRQLLEELLSVGSHHGFHAVFARIVGGHEASIALHAACGFELVGVEREVGRKFGRWQDVVVMERLL